MKEAVVSILGLVVVFFLSESLQLIRSDELRGRKLILQDSLLENGDFPVLLEEILFNNLNPYKCVAIICDNIYVHLFKSSWFRKFKVYITFFLIRVEEYEDLYSPFNETQDALQNVKKEGCQAYIIFLANGMQVARLLRFGDRYRVLDTRAKFLLLYDQRLFDRNLHYLWKRIINVIFIREYSASKKGKANEDATWFEISTVPFPSPISSVFVPRRLDIWRKSKFRTGIDLFRDKTSDIRNQTLKVVVYAHIPGVAKIEVPKYKSVRTIIAREELGFSGLEVELLQSISEAMNFVFELYEPDTEMHELWGRKQKGGQFSGLFGEMVRSNADIALGNLYYTPYILELMDLTIPYNAECLTFLTPESLTDNSWKTLVLPFTSLMWAAVIVCLILTGFIFYWIARFHFHVNKIKYECMKREKELLKKRQKVTLVSCPIAEKLDSGEKYTKMKEQYQLKKFEGQPEGLHIFGELINSFLYTYSMLLLVSIPKLPTGWSLRMLTGWYWLYCTLVVVAYRASMTAILANPAPRVTIDTLQQLVDSKLSFGGWGEINREFFKTSLDSASQTIGSRFEMINNSDAAVDRVADGKFAFYENAYFLEEAAVQRQLRSQGSRSILDTNGTQISSQNVKIERNLHIMSDCVINMPISIGLQKNSPIKLRVNKFIRRVLEAGLITKWLDDVMQTTTNAKIPKNDSVKAVMNMQKFFGALVALIIGHVLGILVLIVEIVYYNCYVKGSPTLNKYYAKIIHLKQKNK